MKSNNILNKLLLLLNIITFALCNSRVCVIGNGFSSSCTSKFVLFEDGITTDQIITITTTLNSVSNFEITNSKFEEILLIKMTSNGFSISTGDGLIRSFGGFSSIYKLGSQITFGLVSFQSSFGLLVDHELVAEIPLLKSGPYMISSNNLEDESPTYTLGSSITATSKLCSLTASKGCSNSSFVGIPNQSFSSLSITVPIINNGQGLFLFSIAGYTQKIGLPLVEIAANTEEIFITSNGKTLYNNHLPDGISKSNNVDLILSNKGSQTDININGISLGSFDLQSSLSNLKFLFQAINKPSMNVHISA